MHGAIGGSSGFGRGGSNFGQGKNVCTTLNKEEFMAKFYQDPNKKEIPKIERTESFKSNNTRKPLMGKEMVRRKSSIENFYDKQASFSKRLSFAGTQNFKNEKEKEPVKPKRDDTLFDKFKKDYSDPFEKAREASATLGQINIINTCMFILGLFSLLTSGICYSFEYSEDYDYRLYVLLSLCMGCSIVEATFYYVKLRLQVELMIHRKEAHHNSKIQHVYSLKDISLEFVFILLHPSPFLVGIKVWFYSEQINNMVFYHMNDLLCIVMSIKWAYITSLIIFRSEYANSRSNRVCNMFGTKCDSLFIVKCLLKDNPFFYIFSCFFSGICIFANILMISEKPLDRIETGFIKHTFYNSVWSTICTMTTVGYGDIYPRTFLGRSVGFCCSQYGSVMVSLLVVTFGCVISFNNQQSCAFTVIKKLKSKEQIKKVASELLIVINKKTDKSDIDSEYKRYCKIKVLIDAFRACRFHYKSIQEVTTHEVMERNFCSVISHLTDIKDMVIDQNEWFEENYKKSSSSSSSSSKSSELINNNSSVIEDKNDSQNVIEEESGDHESVYDIFDHDELHGTKKTKEEKKINRRFSGISSGFMQQSKRSISRHNSKKDSRRQSKNMESCSEEMINSNRKIITDRINSYNNPSLFQSSIKSTKQFPKSNRLIKHNSLAMSETNIVNPLKEKFIIHEQLSEENSVCSTPKVSKHQDIETSGVFKENDNEIIAYKSGSSPGRKSGSSPGRKNKKTPSYETNNIQEGHFSNHMHNSGISKNFLSPPKQFSSPLSFKNILVSPTNKSSSKKSLSYDFEEINECDHSKNDLLPLRNKTQDRNSKLNESDIDSKLLEKASDLFLPLQSGGVSPTRIKKSKIEPNSPNYSHSNNNLETLSPKKKLRQKSRTIDLKRAKRQYDNTIPSLNGVKKSDSFNKSRDLDRIPSLNDVKQSDSYIKLRDQYQKDQNKETPKNSPKNVRKVRNLLDVLHDMGKNKVAPTIPNEILSSREIMGMKNLKEEIQSNLSEKDKGQFLTEQHPLSSEIKSSEKTSSNKISFREKKASSNISKKNQNTEFYSYHKSSSESSDKEPNEKQKKGLKNKSKSINIKKRRDALKDHEIIQNSDALDNLVAGLSSLIKTNKKVDDKMRKKSFKQKKITNPTKVNDNSPTRINMSTIRQSPFKRDIAGNFTAYKTNASYVPRKQKEKRTEIKKNIKLVSEAEIQSNRDHQLKNQASFFINKKTDAQTPKAADRDKKITPFGMLLKARQPSIKESDASIRSVQMKTSDKNIKIKTSDNNTQMNTSENMNMLLSDNTIKMRQTDSSSKTPLQQSPRRGYEMHLENLEDESNKNIIKTKKEETRTGNKTTPNKGNPEAGNLAGTIFKNLLLGNTDKKSQL